MIIKQNGEFIETSEEFRQIEARINQKDLGIIATLLSSNQYSDPERSFIREIVSNAWDAHVAANNTDQPVLVIIGNEFVQIRDYGVGLSQEDFEEIYCAIGSSNKRESNDFIGGFGLGHLSSLACSDTVFIDDYFEGKVYHYIMTKEANNITTLLTDIEDTTEHNGLSVKIDINNRYKYIQALDNIIFFPNVYVDGCEDYNNTQIKRHEHYSVANKRTTDRILLGNVSYPINDNLFPSHIQQILRDVYWTGVVFNFAIGELDVTPNRENLIYTEDSIKLITQRIEAAWKEIGQRITQTTHQDYDRIIDYARALKSNHFDPFKERLDSNGVSIDSNMVSVSYKGTKPNQRICLTIANHTVPCMRYVHMNSGWFGPKTRNYTASKQTTFYNEMPLISVTQPVTDWVKDAIEEDYAACMVVNGKALMEDMKAEIASEYTSWDQKALKEIAEIFLTEFLDRAIPKKFIKPKELTGQARIIKTIIHQWNSRTWESIEIDDLIKYLKGVKKGVVILRKDEPTDDLLSYWEWRRYTIMWLRKDIYEMVMKANLTNVMDKERSLKRASRYNSLCHRFDNSRDPWCVIRHMPNTELYHFHFGGKPVTEDRDPVIEQAIPKIEKYLQAYEELDRDILLDTSTPLFWYIFSKMYKLRVSDKLFNDKYVKICSN